LKGEGEKVGVGSGENEGRRGQKGRENKRGHNPVQRIQGKSGREIFSEKARSIKIKNQAALLRAIGHLVPYVLEKRDPRGRLWEGLKKRLFKRVILAKKDVTTG